MKKQRDICELPVMKSNCKTCPFKKLENGSWQDVQLANAVISRTLFTGQQVCHGTEGINREPNHRCRGAFDHNKEIYDRMGCGNLISEEATTKEQLRLKLKTADSIVTKILLRPVVMMTAAAAQVQGDEKLCRQYLMELYEQKHNIDVMIEALGKRLYYEIISYVEQNILVK